MLAAIYLHQLEAELRAVGPETLDGRREWWWWIGDAVVVLCIVPEIERLSVTQCVHAINNLLLLRENACAVRGWAVDESCKGLGTNLLSLRRCSH